VCSDQKKKKERISRKMAENQEERESHLICVLCLYVLLPERHKKMLMQFFDILCLRGGNLNAFRYLTAYGEGE
jgi:hypothetical protein